MDHQERDVLLLMFDLAALEDEEQICRLFLESLQVRLAGLSVSLTHEPPALGRMAIPVQTPRSGFGTLLVDGASPLSPELQDVLRNAATWLALLLENRRQAAQLREERQHLDRQVAVRTRKLQESEARYRTLFETVSAGILVVNREGRFILANHMAQEILGATQDELLARTIDDSCWQLVKEDGTTLAKEDTPLQITLRTGKPLRDVMMGIFTGTPPRARWLLTNTNAVRDEEGTIQEALVAFVDITEHRRLQEHLMESRKLEAIGQLAGGVAHDFNNLLMIINGYTDTLFNMGCATKPCRQGLEEIRRAGEKAAELTQQLLAFARRQVLQPQVLNLNACVTEMESLMGRILGENVLLSTALLPGLPSVSIDPSQLRQVILNLIINARDAMCGHGRLHISTSLVRIDGERPGHNLQAGTYAVISFTDSGCGIPQEKLPHLFEPFYTTKPTGEGPGLGLPMAYGIIRQSGGEMEVESNPGQGTTFRILLPLMSDAVITLPAEAPPLPEPETILLAEDEEGVRRLVARILRSAGFRVLEAGSGSEALELLSRNGSVLNILVSDVMMPGMTGPELADRILADHPGLPILFISGYPDEVLNRHGLSISEAPLLPKPFTAPDLIRRVRELLSAHP